MARWLAACLLTVFAAGAAENRFHLCDQYEWGHKTGLYASFENRADQTPLGIATLKLAIGIGDGQRWQFVTHTPAWQFDHDYRLKVTTAPAGTEVWLDGQSLGKLEGTFQPHAGALEFNVTPPWATAPTAYLVVPLKLHLEAGGKTLFEREFGTDTSPGRLLFGPPEGERADLALPPALTLESTFRLAKTPSLRELSPVIDKYGQNRYADWPGKVKSDDDLKRAAEDERARHAAWGKPKGFDRFGGWLEAGWKEPATGFFRVVRRDGFCWLISPEGNPCFYLGIGTAPSLTWDMTPVTGREFVFAELPPKTGPYAAWGRNPWGGEPDTAYVAPHTANLIRRDGEAWDKASLARVADRAVTWGFGGLGKWGGTPGLVTAPVLWPATRRLAGHPDFYDPDIAARLREGLREKIEPRRNDPEVLGWSFGNEFDEQIKPEEIVQILGMAATVPSKVALVDHALAACGGDAAALGKLWGVAATTREQLLAAQPKPKADDVEALRRFYEDAYYTFLYRTVKELDPNHLYLGNWIVPGWWVNEDDWRIIGRHCDVIGYDRYAQEFADERLNRLMRETDKPILCGEFSFPATYRGTRGYGVYGTNVPDDAASGDAYRRYVEAAARNPYCIGTMWFQYRDQPLTGRGPGHGDQLIYGEHYAFGLVDVTDRPKWDLVERIRATNLQAAGWRVEANHTPR